MARRPKICARVLDAGPGTCGYWWESCPEKVGHCFNRYVREHGQSNGKDRQIDRDQAEAWERARDAALLPQSKLI